MDLIYCHYFNSLININKIAIIKSQHIERDR